MRLERLSDKNMHLFERAISLYKSAFPVEERRDDLEQKRVLNKDAYHFDLLREDDDFIGIMLYWEQDSFVFLEHFAICPERRGQGLGSKALKLLKEKGKTVLLEIEPPIDEITQRRYDFYRQNHFIMNPHFHIQAKYHLGDDDLELKILSFPKVLTQDEYRSFYQYMMQEIGIEANQNKDVRIRPMQDSDDLNQIAKLIYLTDPYVYPNWFDSLEDGQKVLREMIQLPMLYNKKNITVAEVEKGEIAGIIVSKQTPFVEEEKYLRVAFERAGVPCDRRTHEVFNAYYAKMGNVEDEYYLANVSVDERYRKRGIASAMIAAVIQDKNACTLECVIANTGSWRLYQRLGFEILFEYPGVHDVPCYKMKYQRKGEK